jgi:hypothetical protein
MPSRSQKVEAGENFSADFCTRNFLGLSWHAVTPLIAALSPGHSDITRFSPWSPIATGNYLDQAEKVPKFVQTNGTVVVFDPHSDMSGPTSRRAFAFQMLKNDGPNPLT